MSMKTMQKLCKKFNRMFPSYCADLDEFNSSLGYYRVVILDLNTLTYYPRYFTSTRDFNSWINDILPF